MNELIIAAGLFLVLEGLIYAVFPGGIKRMAEQLPFIPDQTLRTLGIVVMTIGVGIVWLAKG
ncbi:DUF2065 domain-containing protein [Salaquimonas pukyongi]|uniref:DUF2065 domain-containing protein n=1 Tax=Salaquimonas pukyongi TaxID=2712698 RepID=UPI00096BBDB2|nr:DUF2065 domain-containing protein [Salaquimonas pukyongi]